MDKTRQKLTAALLSALLLSATVVSAPLTTTAAEAKAETVGASSGVTGDCTWTLDNDGVLTISGQGKMGDYGYYSSTLPWGTGVRKAVIENGVTNIGEAAFAYCSGLTDVAISDSVTSIGEGAFNKTGLREIVIPDSVKSIDWSAFKSCIDLKTISIGSGLSELKNDAFFSCNNITAITVADNNPMFDSRGNCHAVIATASNILVLPCQKTVIPDSVTYIGNGAYAGCTWLTGITIPDSVTGIGDGAFRFCSRLTAVTIPDSVTYIGDDAFEYCEGLTAVTIPDSVTYIGDDAFEYCEGLTAVKIPNSVKSIGEAAFSHCHNLTKIIIPAEVESIGETFIPFEHECWFDGEHEDENEDHGYWISAFEDCAENFTICGYAGTYAETYAEKYGIPFFDLKNAGDTDGKAGITIDDVTAIQQYLAEMIAFGDNALLAADTNGDGAVDINDATLLQQYLAEYDVVLG